MPSGLPAPLPPGARLVHIGPHKTGSTAIQAAFHHARSEVARQSVHYAGSGLQPYDAVLGLTQLAGWKGRTPGTEADWLALVAECDRAGDDRVVVSCESLANAHPEHMIRLHEDLGRERVHVVRMLRRLDRLAPSQWQQAVVNGGVTSYPDFLTAVSERPRHRFWRRYGFAGLTSRWAEVVGTDRVHAVVVNEDDREWLLRVMERFTALTPGTLPLVADLANRSLDFGQTEMLRSYNVAANERAFVPEAHLQFIRRAVTGSQRLAPRDPEAERPEFPETLIELFASRTNAGLRRLAQLGTPVIGEVSGLRALRGGAAPGAVATVRVDVAAAALHAVAARWAAGISIELSADAPPPVCATDLADMIAALMESTAELHAWSPEISTRFLGGLRGELGPSYAAASRSVQPLAPDRRVPATTAGLAIAAMVSLTDPRRSPA